MQTPLHRVRYTYEEYVAFEASSNVKHEFFDGQIYAMAGGTPEHAALAMAVGATLFSQLRNGPCRAYSSDLRVFVVETGLATYADVTILCGGPEHDPRDRLAVTNPTLVVEVTSRSTESYDRGDKLEHYKRIPSLAQVVIVSHREKSLDVWTRGVDGQWTCSTAREGDTAALPSIDAHLDVRELYR